MPSVHPAIWQIPLSHTPVVQSEASVQVRPGPQRGQLVNPPQSMSLSPWFLTTSSQVGS
jgi:hypothetical protein